MAKKRIKDLNRSDRKAKRQIDRMVKRQDKAAEKRNIQAKEREEANIARQEMINDTTPGKQYTKKKKRYDKKVERKVEKGQYKSDGTRMTQDDFMAYDQKIQSKENKRQERQQKKAVRKGLMKSLGSAISDRASKEGTEFIEDLTSKIEGGLDKPASEMIDANKEGAKAAQNIAKNATTAESLTDASKVKEDVKEGVKAEAEKQEQQDEQMKEALDEAAETQAQGSAIKEEAEKGTGGYTLQDDGSIDLEKAGKAYQESRKKWAATVGKTTTQKLDHTDYYPPQQEFLQSTFTGARIGSQQIVSAVPARIPLGLYDARRRAMAEKAKQKEAFLKELKLETAEQFQGKLNQAFLEDMYEVLDQTGGDVEGLEKGDTKLSQEWMRRKRKWEDLAKAIQQTDEALELAWTNASEDKGTFVSRKARKTIRDYRAARGDFKKMMDDPDAIEKVLSLGRDVTAYTSFSKKADERIKQLVEGDGWQTMIKNGADFQALDPNSFYEKYGETKEQYAQNAMDALETVVSKRDYDMYSEKFLKYFPLENIQSMVRKMYDFNMMYEGEGTELDPEILEDSVEYVLSQLPTQLDSKIHTVVNNAYQWDRTAWDKEKTAEAKKTYHQDMSNVLKGLLPELTSSMTTANQNDFELKYINELELNASGSNAKANQARYGYISATVPDFVADKTYDIPTTDAKFYMAGSNKQLTFTQLQGVLTAYKNAGLDASGNRKSGVSDAVYERASEASFELESLQKAGNNIPTRGVAKREYEVVKWKGKDYPMDLFKSEVYDKLSAADKPTAEEIEAITVPYVDLEGQGAYQSGVHTSGPDKGKPRYKKYSFIIVNPVNIDGNIGQAPLDGVDPDVSVKQQEWYKVAGQ